MVAISRIPMRAALPGPRGLGVAFMSSVLVQMTRSLYWPAQTMSTVLVIWSRNVVRSAPGREMLGQLQALALVVRAALAIQPGRPPGQRLIDQPGHDLAVLQQERRVVGAHLQHRARAGPLRLVDAEARIEEARVVHA